MTSNGQRKQTSLNMLNKPYSLVLYPGIIMMNYCTSASAPNIKARCCAAALTPAHELTSPRPVKLFVMSLPMPLTHLLIVHALMQDANAKYLLLWHAHYFH